MYLHKCADRMTSSNLFFNFQASDCIAQLFDSSPICWSQIWTYPPPKKNHLSCRRFFAMDSRSSRLYLASFGTTTCNTMIQSKDHLLSCHCADFSGELSLWEFFGCDMVWPWIILFHFCIFSLYINILYRYYVLVALWYDMTISCGTVAQQIQHEQ